MFNSPEHPRKRQDTERVGDELIASMPLPPSCTESPLTCDSLVGLLPRKTFEQLSALIARGEVQVRDQQFPMTISESLQVQELFELTYQGSYRIREFEEPDQLPQSIARGDLVSLLIYHPHSPQQLVGHAGIFPGHAQNFTFGMIAVTPEFQSQGLSKLLMAMRLEYLEPFHQAGKVAVLDSEARCSHPASQKNLEHLGFRPNGIHFGIYNTYPGSSVRESVLCMSRIVNPEIRKARNIIMPDPLIPLVQQICILHGVERVFLTERKGIDFHEQLHSEDNENSIIEEDFDLPGFGSIYHEIKGAVKGEHVANVCDLAFRSHQAIFGSVVLSLENPFFVEQADALLAKGYRFGSYRFGIHADELVLQRCAVSIEELSRGVLLNSPEAKILFDLMNDRGRDRIGL